MGAPTLPALVQAAAAAYGDAPAYVEDGRSLSFLDLRERVAGVAQVYAERGLRPGDRVALWGPNSIDWAVAALAITWAGGTLVPLNSRYTVHEVADLVERSAARITVVHDGFLGRTQLADLVEQGVDGVIDLAELARLDRGADLPPADVSTHDVADILFTSGTTGRPKGAMSAHRQTIGVAQVWAELGGVRAEDRYLVVNPFFHSFGYKIGIVVGLLTGCTLHPVPTFDVDQAMELIEREQITVLPGAPTLYQSILTSPRRAEFDLSSLRLAVTGAAVVPVALIERMRAPSPAGLEIDQVVTAFGMTEAVVVTMCRETDSAQTVATTSGRPVPGMEISLGDQDELLVRGDHVMLGYLDDPEATAAAIDADGWLHTGDVAAIDEDGNLRVTDRLKDMYISGGFNVYPAEVEQTLARLEGVVEAAVVGVPDERLGEVGKAYVVTDPNHGPGPTTEHLIEFCRERLANFKVPRQVELVDSLPRNLSGKVLKTELRSNA